MSNVTPLFRDKLPPGSLRLLEERPLRPGDLVTWLEAMRAECSRTGEAMWLPDRIAQDLHRMLSKAERQRSGRADGGIVRRACGPWPVDGRSRR